jgi:hypothetical protein
MRNVCKIFIGKPEGLKNLGVDGRIILKRLLREMEW